MDVRIEFYPSNNICALLCALSALLALPLFLLLLFITGLFDHFFETPIDQFRWSDVDVREQVIRDLLGPHLSNTNLRTDQSSALINPWPHLFPHPLIEPNCRQHFPVAHHFCAGPSTEAPVSAAAQMDALELPDTYFNNTLKVGVGIACVRQ
uniref:Uncharacterized protein n=1 Tax=Globodera rostochiensis TaxID=31243 RepID=A0A914GNX5_GLORO